MRGKIGRLEDGNLLKGGEMRKLGSILVALLLLGSLLLVGCGQKGTSLGPEAEITDRAEIEGLIKSNSDYFTSDVRIDSSAYPLGKVLEGIEPVSFFREIKQFTKDIDIHIVHPDTGVPYAEVAVTANLIGQFHTITMDSTYLKPIDDTAVRFAYFEKTGRPRPPRHHRGWELKKISGVEIYSNPCTKVIKSIHISSDLGSVDTVIIDVTTLMDKEDIFTFKPGELVTLEVETDSPEDIVFLHIPHKRMPFQHVGGGLYVGSWRTTTDPWHFRWPKHAAVDVIDHGTIFDDQAPYDSRAWGMNYRVKR